MLRVRRNLFSEVRRRLGRHGPDRKSNPSCARATSTAISIDSSCLMQLQGAINHEGLPIRTMHLAEVLASR